MPVPDEIPPDCIAYRMIEKINIKPDGTPNSDSFTDMGPTSDTYYMSIYLRDQLLDEGWTVQGLKAEWEGYEAFEITVGELREHGELVWRAPMGKIPGHAAVKRPQNAERTRGQKRKLAKTFRLATEEPEA
ncbi:hypothetical protein [Actinomycetospora sp. CA-084318]|uniref:hypothetical protein n=1 Tax=Actinomycetospora sp. CA-084318 TaxID=3239892 RepID=UPI003D986DD2